jgi:hypothetical protein
MGYPFRPRSPFRQEISPVWNEAFITSAVRMKSTGCSPKPKAERSRGRVNSAGVIEAT